MVFVFAVKWNKTKFQSKYIENFDKSDNLTSSWCFCAIRKQKNVFLLHRRYRLESAIGIFNYEYDSKIGVLLNELFEI